MKIIIILNLLVAIFFAFLIRRQVAQKQKDMYSQFKVIGGYRNENEANEMLNKLNDNALMLIDHLVAKYPKNKNVRILKRRYKPKNLCEADPRTPNDTSFTIGKGRKLAMCIRQKDGVLVNNEGVLMSVLLHEMAHIALNMTGHDGHDELFWRWTKFLSEEAKKINIYVPVDYSKHPADYCKIQLNSNPYFMEFGPRKK